MLWLFAAVILVCAILFPRFRKVLLGIAALLVCIAVVGYFWLKSEESRDASEEAASKKRISLNEIELADVELRKENYGSTTYVMTGRVRNRSARYTLSDFTIRITLEDCMSDTFCDVVLQRNESPHAESVPPGQARDFTISSIAISSIGLGSNLRLKGRLRWNYNLVETHGSEPAKP
jgi:hypothetical protein